MTIAEELLALERDGIIEVHAVHDWAEQHKDSAVGRRLEWDDSIAGRNYRLQQIRHLVAVYIRDSDGRRQTISLISDRTAGGGYRDIQDVFSHREMREAALRQALAELERLQDLYGYLNELSEVFEEAERVRARSGRIRRRSTGAGERAAV